MKNQLSHIMVGVIFILFGLVLMLNKLGIIYFTWFELYPVLFVTVSVFAFLGVGKGNKNAAFWGGFFGMMGIFFLLRNFGFVASFWIIGVWPVTILSLGLAFILLYLFKPRDWSVLIPGVFFLFISVFVILKTIGIDTDFILEYWPVLLIIIGLAMVKKSLSGHSNGQTA